MPPATRVRAVRGAEISTREVFELKERKYFGIINQQHQMKASKLLRNNMTHAREAHRARIASMEIS